MSSETSSVATSSKVTCRIDSADFTHRGISILEAARRTAITHCRAYGVEGLLEVGLEYSHDGRVIRDSVQV